LLRAAGIVPAWVCVAMIQGDRWRADWPDGLAVVGAFASPLFDRTAEGWRVRRSSGVDTPGHMPI
jgi:hypothetical protein